MKITAAQINPLVGAVKENTERVLAIAREAHAAGSDLVVFSELIITGYPPQDLLERPAFIDETQRAVETIVEASRELAGTAVIIGCPRRAPDDTGKGLFNSALLIADGRILFEQAKLLLPMYDVFDEARYFKAVTDNAVFDYRGTRLALSICEDLWFEPDPWNRRPYQCDPIGMLAEKGADLFINISASPFSKGKEVVRHDLITAHSRKHGVPFLFVNQVGGNDDLVFDGSSLFVSAKGDVVVAWPGFEEKIDVVDLTQDVALNEYAFKNDLDAMRDALVLGTRDYVHKCGFEKVVIGLSGGVDSALTAAIAVEALGADNVLGIAMPSPHSSQGSIDDARALADNLGIRLDVVPIEELMAAYDSALATSFKGQPPNECEENIQARIRGNIIMAYSNKFGYLPLSTGNKSELAVGYCTLYGDMSGGLAVISDLPKTLVYDMVRHMNQDGEVVPASIVEKAPSAELKPDQKDQDTLPPYVLLDGILELYIDKQMPIGDIVAAGYDPDTVAWIVAAVRRNEFKRKQAAPGLKVTSKAFGSGRRMPIAARYDV